MNSLDLRTTPLVALDVETTGFAAGKNDRIVEIALVRMTPGGSLSEEYTTLVNPRRDVGPTHVHGITATEVRDAPSFPEIAGDVADRIDGAVVVAHNARFDTDFLRAEFARVGIRLPELPTICTLRLAHELKPGAASRKLVHCCAEMGVPFERAHSALDDAKATGRLCHAFLELGRQLGRSSASEFGCDSGLPPRGWCFMPPAGASVRRSNTAPVAPQPDTPHSFLADVVERLPAVAFPDPATAEYLFVLDRCIADRQISEDEADELLRIALNWGLTRPQVFEANHAYLLQLVGAALADHVVTADERSDLNHVASLLGLPVAAVDRAIHDVAHWMNAPTVRIEQAKPAPSGSLAGKTVCFTGEFTETVRGERITREVAESLASDAGMFVRPKVTKAVELLVLSDVNSMSSKAKKAREYGISLMSARDFLSAIGALEA